MFHNARADMEKRVLDTMQSSVDQIATDIDGRIERETDFTKYIAYNVKFRELIQKDAFDNVTIAQQMNDQWDPTFWYFLTSDANLKSVKIYTPYLSSRVGSFLVPDSEVKNEKWYKYQQSNFETKWWSTGDTIYATRTILSPDVYTKQNIGIIYAEFYSDKLFEPLSSSNYLDNGFILTDSSGNKLLSRSTGTDLVDAEAKTLSNGNTKETYGKNCLFISKTMESTGFKISYYVDKSQMNDYLIQIIGTTLVVVVVCLILCFILIGIVAKRLSMRIMTLKNAVNEIESGNLNQNIHSDSTDEIGVVANSIGKMSKRLSFLINQVYKSELEVLQAKINPHFLYNCLSAIKWKAIETDSSDISEMTGLLAKFYRTSLNNGKMITTVESEIENIRSYTEILSLTHDNRFDVAINIDDDCSNFKMLNFLLQPIVENAFNHGIKQTENDERGFIIIDGKREGAYLCFSVINSGPAIDVENIDELLSKESTGYGLRNVVDRIKLYYGSGCGIETSLTDEGDTCFTIKILTEVKDDTVL